MIFVVSGEGSSDIGICTNSMGECSGADFRPGPMAVLVDKLVEPIAGYSLLDAQAVEFVGEVSLSRRIKSLPMALSVGKKREYESAHFFKGARALARVAVERRTSAGCPVGAVFFRDADGTRSNERGLCEAKVKSMEDGFRAEAFEHGVPMVPKPKSEAWLICALKAQPYQHCAPLEDSLSGNDNSPNPAKEQLEALLTSTGRSVGQLSDMVASGTISATRIDMPSFRYFRQRLEEVARSLLGLPQVET